MSFEVLSDQQIWDIANPIMDNLMEASTQIDHARHVRDFSPRLRQIVRADYLERICRDYQAEKGFFSTRSPVALFRRPESIALIWKQRFSKAQGEFVAEMVLIKEGENILVDHVMVF